MSINSQGQKKKKDSSQFLSNIFTRMIFIERNIKDTPFMNIRACIVFFFFSSMILQIANKQTQVS